MFERVGGRLSGQIQYSETLCKYFVGRGKHEGRGLPGRGQEVGPGKSISQNFSRNVPRTEDGGRGGLEKSQL